jgi:EAL domain-containing protein (putative c-di-GMP-specific phosphodiesterase class I)/CHASE2 domain-containing sensor protein
MSRMSLPSPLIALLRRRWRPLALGLAACAGVLVGGAELGAGAEHMLQDWRFALRRHAASGDLAIIEIDAHSIAHIDRWPWPRRDHAALIDQLRRAGAAAIAFDVDFSSRSNAEDDAALTAALKRADGQVILPTFSQSSGSGRRGLTDSLPVRQLRDHAMLASIIVAPDPDGVVRNVPLGAITAGVPRPALSAILAQRGGDASAQFPIDYAIDPATIPRLSFIDVRDGHFDPAAVRGKRVLIGATAIEIGDRYVAPAHGVLPGVVIQALAAETLLQGMPAPGGWIAPLVVALLLAGMATFVSYRQRWMLGGIIAAGPVLLFLTAVAAASSLGWVFELLPALVAWAVATSAMLAMRVAEAVGRARAHDAQSGLPNRLALVAETRDGVGPLIVATARIADYEKIVASIGGDAVGDLIRRVRDRVSLLGAGSTVYRVEDRVLGWCATVDAEQLTWHYEQLRALMLAPVEVQGRKIDVSLVIGMASGQPRDAGRVVANAILAAAQAQAAGAGWHVHAEREGEEAARDLSLLGELDEAVALGALRVLYQPKFDIAHGHIGGVEALVRWIHPERGMISPDAFIPLAERNDRIAGLTLFVLGQTIADLGAWEAVGSTISGAVNISAKLLGSEPFLAAARKLVEDSGLAPGRLVFEVTESAAMIDGEGAIAALQGFKAMGIGISMDDYGTGQSTLSYLKRLPLDELKIDRSFVQFAHRNRSDGVLVRSTIELAHELGLKVVAEGVEDEECLAFLRDAHCDMAQGYLISRPVDAVAIAALLTTPRELAA